MNLASSLLPHLISPFSILSKHSTLLAVLSQPSPAPRSTTGPPPAPRPTAGFSAAGTSPLGTSSPGPLPLGRPQLPMHHGPPFSPVGEENSQEHEETPDETESAHGILGLIGDVKVADGVRHGGLDARDFVGGHLVYAIVGGAEGRIQGGARLARRNERPGRGVCDVLIVL